ncbi:MAG: hypothetical protein ACKO14_09310 [Armatimonadota bacterium]
MLNQSLSRSGQRGLSSIPKPIEMLPAGQNVFIGLCQNLVVPHHLVVGENLFIFLHANMDLSDVVRSVQEVMSELPMNCGWRPVDPNNAIRLDWVAQMMASREMPGISHQPRTEIRRRLMPA